MRTRYRLWYDPAMRFWNVSPNRDGTDSRNKPFIICKHRERALTLLAKRLRIHASLKAGERG